MSHVVVPPGQPVVKILVDPMLAAAAVETSRCPPARLVLHSLLVLAQRAVRLAQEEIRHYEHTAIRCC